MPWGLPEAVTTPSLSTRPPMRAAPGGNLIKILLGFLLSFLTRSYLTSWLRFLQDSYKILTRSYKILTRSCKIFYKILTRFLQDLVRFLHMIL